MDDEDLLVQQLVKSLAFEVEAVAAENIIKFSTTGTPLNVKVRVRNKDEPRLVQRGLVSVPRIGNQLTAPEKIRLISSDQTILSFNVYMETDLEKETQTPKSRKHGFNFLKFGGCLGTSVGKDDDEGAYEPETSNISQSGIIIDEIEGSQERVKLNMENSKIVTRNQKGFFGKCKPGGCLDPPFSEDRYPYGLPKTQQQPTPNLALNKTEKSKDHRSNSISSVEKLKLSKLTDEPIKKGQRPSRSEVESKPLVDLFARTSSSQNSLGSNHSNLITYPPRLSSSEMIRDNEDTRRRNKSKTFNESPRQSNENPVAYFVPPKDTLRQKEEERRYSRELSSDQIRINDDSVKDATSRNNGNRKRTLRNHSFETSSINNAKFAEIKPIAVSASQGREENYPKRVKQTLTDLTLNNNDNVPKLPLQERKKSDMLLLTPHVDQIENIKNPKISEIKPIAFGESQGREENYPKRVEQTSRDATLNDKDNVRITPLQGRAKNGKLLLTPHVDQIENVNDTKKSEIKTIAVSASQDQEKDDPKRVEQTSRDATLNDKDNVRITPLQGREKSDTVLPTPHMNQIKQINDRSNVIIQSVPVPGSNNLDDFDNKYDLHFETKSQLNNEETLDYDGISSDNMFKKLGDKKDIFYDSKDKTKKDKTMPTAQTLESETDQNLQQNEIPTEPQSQTKKTKLTLKTTPNFSSSLKNLLDTSELKGINKVVSDTSSQNTQTKAKKDTNTYPSTSADADKIKTFPNKSEATKSQTQKSMEGKQNKDFILLSNAAEVSDPEQPLKQDFPSSDADPIKSQSVTKRTQEAFQDNRVKESSEKVDATDKSDTINKLIEDPDIFNKQTYDTPASTTLKTEINNGTVQDQLNHLDTREFKNKATDGKLKEKDDEGIANIYGSTEEYLNNTDRYIDPIKSNAHPDKQNIMNNLKMPMYSSQAKNGHDNINDVGISESHVMKPFMTENGDQGINDHVSQTQLIIDASTEKRQANKKLQKTASHDSTVSENKEFATYSAHSLGSYKKMTSTYDDTKKPVNIQHHKDKSSGPEIAKPSSVDHVIIQNDLVFDHNEIPHTESREKRSSLVKIPFTATGSDLRSDETSKMIPLKHKGFPIVESNKSVEKQIEEISTLQNLTYGGSRTENDNKSVPRGQSQERVLSGREIDLLVSDSALNLTNLDKEAKTLLHDSDKKASEIIGVSIKGDKTNVDDADSTYFQPQLPITETERSKIVKSQLTSGLHQDYATLSLGLPSDDTNQIDNIGFKSPEPLTPGLNIDNATENISDNRIGMDREEDSETKKQDLMENMEKPPTSTSDQYFKELLKDRNAKLATKPSSFNDMNVSQSNVNQLADQLSSKIMTDEINKEVKTLPINYTLEDGTTIFNPTMEKTYIGTDKISSAITHQETSGSSIMANSARKDNPQLSTTAVGKMDSDFNAANLNYAGTETLDFMHDTKTYDDMPTITSAPLKSTVGDYNLEKTVPQLDEFTDDTIINRLGLGVKKDTNNKNVQKQKDIANFMKKSDLKMGRGSKKSIDEPRRMLLNVTKPSNNKSTPLSKFLDTDSMNKTNLESLDISAIPTEKEKFELLLNMKFQTYVNENNNIVVQTLNPLTEAQDLESEKVTIVNSLLRPGNEINIQVDSEHNLTLGLYDSYHMGGYQKYDELKAYQHVSPDATENEIVLYKNLTLLYETELVPLHSAIMSLTEEINALSVNQELLKAKLQGAKRNRSTRISPVSRHCGCRRS